jgi:hypothetical protein
MADYYYFSVPGTVNQTGELIHRNDLSQIIISGSIHSNTITEALFKTIRATDGKTTFVGLSPEGYNIVRSSVT